MLSRLTASLSVLLLLGGFSGVLDAPAAEPKDVLRGGEAWLARKDAQGDPLPENAIARLGTIRLRKDMHTLSVAYSPDGKLIASADRRGAVRVWNAATGEEIALVYDPDGSQQAQRVSFSPDGRYLSYIANGGLYLWDVATKLSPSLPVDLGPLAFSPNGELLVGGNFRELVIFDFKKRAVRSRLNGPKEWIRAVAFSPNGALVATAEGRDSPPRSPGVIRFWDVRAGKQVAEWEGHQQHIDSLCFSPDGKVLASAGFDSVRLWDTGNHRAIASLGGKASVVAYSPNGKLLATGGHSSTVSLWNPITHKLVRSIPTGNGWVSSLVFSPGGKKLLTGGLHHALHLWDVETGREILPFAGHRYDVHSVQFSPDDKFLASRSGDQSVLLWDLTTGKVRHRFSLADDDRLQGRSSNWSPTPSSTLTYAPDGKTVAAVAGSDNNTAFVWAVTSGQKKLTIHTAKHPPSSITFSLDGQVLATAQDGSVRLWSASSGAELRSSPIGGSGPIAFSPDGHILVMSGADSRIYLWDWRARRLIRDFPLKKQQARCLAFSFDGQLLATCGGAHQRKDSAIHLWETATGSHFQTLENKERSVLCIALSPDGRLLASGGEDDPTVHVWDVLTGKELAQFSGHRGNIYCLAFSSDGKTLASGSADTTILLWDISRLRIKPPVTDTDPKTLARLWDELKGSQIAKAYEALWALIGAGDKAVSFLSQRLNSIPAIDMKRIQQWIADLDSDDFAKREAATAQLTKLGLAAEAALRQALQAKPTAEARKRLEQILAGLLRWPATDAGLRQVRALHALELIGSPAARDLLKKLADGAPGAALTRDAALALQRLERRAKLP